MFVAYTVCIYREKASVDVFFPPLASISIALEVYTACTKQDGRGEGEGKRKAQFDA